MKTTTKYFDLGVQYARQFASALKAEFDAKRKLDRAEKLARAFGPDKIQQWYGTTLDAIRAEASAASDAMYAVGSPSEWVDNNFMFHGTMNMDQEELNAWREQRRAALDEALVQFMNGSASVSF